MFIYDVEEARESLRKLEILTERLVNDECWDNEEMLRTIIDNIETPMWGKSCDGRFLAVNKACATKILKTTPDKALELTDDDFAHDAMSEVCMQGDREVIASGRTRRYIEHARYPDGTDLWLDTTKSPYFVDGEIKGTVGIGKDITANVDSDLLDEYANPGRIEIGVDMVYGHEKLNAIIIA